MRGSTNTRSTNTRSKNTNRRYRLFNNGGPADPANSVAPKSSGVGDRDTLVLKRKSKNGIIPLEGGLERGDSRSVVIPAFRTALAVKPREFSSL